MTELHLPATSADGTPWPHAGVDFRSWTVRWLRDGPVPAGTLGSVGYRRPWWRGGRWQVVFSDIDTAEDDSDLNDLPPYDVEDIFNGTAPPGAVVPAMARSAAIKVFTPLPHPGVVELVHPPHSQFEYLCNRLVGRWPRRRLVPWHGDGWDYTGWTARATTDRRVPLGFEGAVVARQQHGDDVVHVIDWLPYIKLHVMLPKRGIDLIPPGAA